MFFKKRETSEIKKWEWGVLAFIIIASLAGKIYYSRWPKATVTINNKELTVLVANTNQHIKKGLSGRKDLGIYDGMLFVFSSAGQHAMTMRDMNFPIDIIWLYGDTIVDIAPNVAPDKSPNGAELIPYYARSPSTLVLELPDGYAVKNKLKIGDKVSVSNI